MRPPSAAMAHTQRKEGTYVKPGDAQDSMDVKTEMGFGGGAGAFQLELAHIYSFSKFNGLTFGCGFWKTHMPTGKGH